jgi:hypothetical protein
VVFANGKQHGVCTNCDNTNPPSNCGTRDVWLTGAEGSIHNPPPNLGNANVPSTVGDGARIAEPNNSHQNVNTNNDGTNAKKNTGDDKNGGTNHPPAN